MASCILRMLGIILVCTRVLLITIEQEWWQWQWWYQLQCWYWQMCTSVSSLLLSAPVLTAEQSSCYSFSSCRIFSVSRNYNYYYTVLLNYPIHLLDDKRNNEINNPENHFLGVSVFAMTSVFNFLNIKHNILLNNNKFHWEVVVTRQLWLITSRETVLSSVTAADETVMTVAAAAIVTNIPLHIE